MSSEDEDLKLAIALSIRGNDSREVINLDGDDDEAVLEASTPARKQPTPPSTLGFLGIDRKKMEQERLARKRKASMSPPRPRRMPKIDEFLVSRTQTVQPIENLKPRTSADPGGSSSANNPKGPPLFLEGTVKKTWAFGHPRTAHDIKIEEVLRKDGLALAVLSSFQWDVAWLLAKMNTNSMDEFSTSDIKVGTLTGVLIETQVTLVMQAKDEGTKQQYRHETAEMRNLRLCFPSMDGQINCMHSKLMLLSYPSHLRVVVPTANLVPYDWGESGDMENMVFIIDLPRLPDRQRSAPETAFGRELIYFLTAMGLASSVVTSVSDFDFSATKRLAFVHTIGGAHTGESWRGTGYCGLGRAVKESGLATDSALNIDFVTSSVGSLNIDFLAMLYLAAQGDDGMTEYGWRNPGTGRGKSKTSKLELAEAEAAQEEIRNEIHDGFHIYFPTHDTVKASTAGFAGTICFQSKWYNSTTFPRDALRDCKSTRTGLLMHNKILYVRPKGAGVPWAYVGSANCSESAWGKLTKDRSTKEPKLNCRNWECGVLIPVQRNGAEQEGLSNFQGKVPVPMQYPGEAYGSKRPWYYAEQ